MCTVLGCSDGSIARKDGPATPRTPACASGAEEISSMQEPSMLTATEAVRLIRNGRLRPEDLMEACLARIAAREAAVRAFAWFDADAARQGAATARPGPLHGLPMGVKDVLDTADMPSEYGSPIWRGGGARAGGAAGARARA